MTRAKCPKCKNNYTMQRSKIPGHSFYCTECRIDYFSSEIFGSRGALSHFEKILKSHQ